jgi:hypothetical protein
MRSAEPPGSLCCAADPAGTHAGGVEAHRSRKHAGKVAALHHGQLAIHDGKAGGALVLSLGQGCAGGFVEELHGAGAKAPKVTKEIARNVLPGHAWSA